MNCDLCVIAKYCLTEPKTWQFSSNDEALRVLNIMNNCLEKRCELLGTRKRKELNQRFKQVDSESRQSAKAGIVMR